jgi:hypothetical protein
MKAIIKKTGKVETIVRFLDNGYVELKDVGAYKPSELTIDYIGELDEKQKHVHIKINSLIGRTIIIGNEDDLDKLKNELKEAISDLKEDCFSLF